MSKKEKTILYAICAVIVCAVVAVCVTQNTTGSREKEMKKLLANNWYRQWSESVSFTLYDDGTVTIPGSYGQGKWSLVNDDVLKISDNEIEFMTGTSDFDKGANILMERYPNIKLLNITAGADGSYSYYREIRAYVPSYLLGGTIDTTGAGDTFCGSVLNYLLDHDLENLSKENLIEMLQIANAAAYLVTTKKGAIRSMPDPKDVQKVVNNNYIRED